MPEREARSERAEARETLTPAARSEWAKALETPKPVARSERAEARETLTPAAWSEWAKALETPKPVARSERAGAPPEQQPRSAKESVRTKQDAPPEVMPLAKASEWAKARGNEQEARIR